MKTVLVGHDGSEAGDAAYRWASRLATAAEATLFVATATGAGGHGLPAIAMEGSASSAPSTLAGWCDRLAANLRTPNERLVVFQGPPASALRDLAKAEDVELIVLGAHRPAGISPWLGSTASDLAHMSKVPLAVIPSSNVPTTGRIVVGVDGSKEALRALDVAVDLAVALGGEIHVVRSCAPPAEWLARSALRDYVNGAVQEVQAWVEPCAVVVSVTTRVAPEHHPVAMLCEEAERIDAEMIAVGTRGAGGFPGMRLGGTAMSLFYHAEHPLLLVPPA